MNVGQKRKKGGFLGGYAVFAALFLMTVIFMTAGLQQAAMQEREEEKRLAEESVRRGVITCYALEGVYPPDYAYLKQNYGVQVNEEKFSVFYEVFASNIMPDITVVEK